MPEAAHHEPEYIAQMLLLLCAAVVVVPLFNRLKLGSILGYLTAGALVGPHGFQLIADVDGTKALAELGVVFLLFMIGLELTFAHLKKPRRPHLRARHPADRAERGSDRRGGRAGRISDPHGGDRRRRPGPVVDRHRRAVAQGTRRDQQPLRPAGDRRAAGPGPRRRPRCWCCSRCWAATARAACGRHSAWRRSRPWRRSR